MIDLLLEHVFLPGRESSLQSVLANHVAEIEASARAGDRRQVTRIEAVVRSDPEAAFRVGADGGAELVAGGAHYGAGRFETASLGFLRSQVSHLKSHEHAGIGSVRLLVLQGTSPATDIGSLQAFAGAGTLFQVASQFNCLESPGPYISRVANYFGDPTQGPRASISAFPGTLLRHYAAPSADGGRFVQTDEGRQIDLLEDVIPPGAALVRGGYLRSSTVADPTALADALESRFDAIRVGVHDEVPVILGYDWDGGVVGDRRIGQVFTSTLAGGAYGGTGLRRDEFGRICATLLRAAYLGTLLASVLLGRRKVVLALIGGGAFGNPVALIWDSMLWAVNEIEPMLGADMDVVLNGRNLGEHVDAETVLAAVRARGGALVQFGTSGATVRR